MWTKEPWWEFCDCLFMNKSNLGNGRSSSIYMMNKFIFKILVVKLILLSSL